MRGIFETQAEGLLVAREEWEIKSGAAGGRVLTARGTEQVDAARSWELEARFNVDGTFDALTLQVRPKDSPLEVVTSGFRIFESRAYGTTLAPEAVPEKLETAFAKGSVFRGFSLALDGLAASAGAMKAGQGRRAVGIALDAPGGRPRVEEFLLLCTSRARVKGPRGEQWAFWVEFRSGADPGRAESTLLVGKDSVVLKGERPGRAPVRRSELVGFVP